MKFALRSILALAMFLPALGFADSIDISNSGGTLSGSNSGLVISGSTFTSITGPFGTVTGDLGTVAFNTSQLISGSLKNGGVFAEHGEFLITSNGNDGGHKGVLFAGIFSGPVTWSRITLANGTHNYTLTGVLSGVWFAGQHVDGATVQLTVNTGSGFFTGHGIRISSGDTSLSGKGLQLVTPEPGSLSLLGIGLVALGSLRRRWSHG